MENPIDRTVEHPIRQRLIEAMWRLGAPLSARRFRFEYTDGSISLATVGYHMRVLERDGIARVASIDSGESIERSVVLAGPNYSEAVRRLGLT